MNILKTGYLYVIYFPSLSKYVQKWATDNK